GSENTPGEGITGRGEVAVWDFSQGKWKAGPLPRAVEVVAVAFSADGRFLAVGCPNGGVQVWDPALAQVQHDFDQRAGEGGASGSAPDGWRLAAGSSRQPRKGSVKIWDTVTGGSRGEFPEQALPGKCTALAFSPDGRLLAAGAEEGTVKVWDAGSGKELGALVDRSSPSCKVLSLAFSPDGRLLAAGGEDHAIRLWEPATNELRDPFRGHDGAVRAVAFARDSRTLASGSNDDTVRLWDVADGRLDTPRGRHGERVNSVAFSPDGRWLATGSSDQTAMLWDLATGQSHPLPGQGANVNAVAFS